MEVREESWEALRGQLFEEVVMYSTMPIDSVSCHKILCSHCTFTIIYYRFVICVEMKILESDVTSVVHLNICATSVMCLFTSTNHYMIGRFGVMEYSKQFLPQLCVGHQMLTQKLY